MMGVLRHRRVSGMTEGCVGYAFGASGFSALADGASCFVIGSGGVVCIVLS